MNNNYNNQNTDNIPENLNNSNNIENDEFSFVVPISNKEQMKRQKNSTKSASKEEIDKATEGFVFAKPHKKRKKKSKTVKIISIILAVIAAILVIAVSTLFIFNQVGKNAMHNYDDMVIEPSPDVTEVKTENDGKTITYSGKTYTFNEDVTSIVFMGIDDKDELGTDVIGTGGQADAVYIAVIDTKGEKVSILGVSRDSMTDVNIYNTNGEFVNTQRMQLCLSYAYGDGRHTSCKNTITSLERMFYGMQFDTYFSMNNSALIDLNDAVGGVTVTTSAPFESDYYGRTISAGETITLHGYDAEKFVRMRDLDNLASNNDRMNRQKEYMKAFLSQAVPAAKSDVGLVLDLYNTITSNSTTNLGASKITYLSNEALDLINSAKDIEFVSVPGKVIKGDEYAQFIVDQNGLMEIMLDLFYIEII